MYNRLLFDCLQVAVDVIFAAVSNQCPQETVVGKTLPTLNVAVEGLIESNEKRRFLRKLRTASGGSFEERLSQAATEGSTLLTCW
jgi:hypothetical protein